MLQRFIVSLLLVLSALAAVGDQGLYHWRHRGGDPCGAGCTVEWALPQTGWPVEVQRALIHEVRTGTSQVFIMKSGWTGWMTWGKYTRKFRMRTVADWGEGVTEQAQMWQVAFNGTTYHLVKVGICRNLGGWTSKVPPPVRHDEGAPLSPLPVGTCE
jgi:hypothetical protein